MKTYFVDHDANEVYSIEKIDLKKEKPVKGKLTITKLRKLINETQIRQLHGNALWNTY